MAKEFSNIAGTASADGMFSPEEIDELRQSLWKDGHVTGVEADTIFLANDTLRGTSEDWREFYVEALAEYAVNAARPKGHVDDARSRWLASRVMADGKVGGMEELLLVVRILERALSVGPALRDLAYNTIELAVTEGTGPTREGDDAAPAGCITEEEVQMLRRIIFAPGSEHPAAVGKQEAELLFRLKDTSRDGENGEGWQDLFVQGVGNYLQGFSGEVLTADRVVELQEFMAEQASGIGGFFRRMAKSDVKTGFAGVGEMLFGEELDGSERAEAVAEAEKVTADEKAWLDEQIDQDGEIDEYEKALLHFLVQA